MKVLKQFGGKVTPDLIQQYEQSANWQDGQFQNLERTDMNMSLSKVPNMLYKQFSNSKARTPKKPLPIVPFDKVAFEAESEKAKLIWYGHSVVLMRMNGKTILIDPMLGDNTTPIAPVANRRFSKNTLSLIDDFPMIDLIILTHDHYDHLDFDSIQKLKSKTKQFFVALGVKRHLVSWGVAAEIITEFDWWDNQVFNDISITFTPTRHFSGRGLSDRFKGLWGGWAFKTATENIWFSGDGGYGKHFKEIGKRLGAFDFAFMECGQYNVDWYEIHLFPKESVQAAIEAKVQKVMPVHWAGFSLSYQHTWTEPAEEFLAACLNEKLPFGTPKIGQLFTIDSVTTEKWWLDF